MSIPLSDASIKTYQQLLPAASNILSKARAHFEENGTDLQEIVQMKLYEDMATFAFQIFSIMHHSVGAINALKEGEFAPPNMPKGLSFQELQDMLSNAEQELSEVSAEEINNLAGKSVIFKMGSIEMPFTSEDFILSFSLPNFYFHVTTMYDMLRIKGLPIGKFDFVGQMRVTQ